MHQPIQLAAVLVMILGCSSEPKGGTGTPAKPTPADPTPVYRKATVSVVRIADVAKDGLASISPSGAARLYRKATPEPTTEGLVEVTWCLHRDGIPAVCLQTGTQQLRCLGGSNAVGWRPDEKAVVLCGEREKRMAGGGSSYDGWDSVLDFDKGRVVQLDPHEGPMVTPIWSRDGKRIFAFPPNGKPHRPWRDTSRLPVSLTPFASPPAHHPVGETDFGPVWVTAGHGVPGAMLFEPPSMARHAIEVTTSSQDILDVTPDRRFAVAEDTSVALGEKGVPWHILVLETKKASPLSIPKGFKYGTHVELSNGGHRLLALWEDADRKTHLSITGDRGANWHLLHSWESGDPDAPHGYVGDGELQWDGGATAWIISKSDAVLRVDLAT